MRCNAEEVFKKNKAEKTVNLRSNKNSQVTVDLATWR